MKKLPYSVAVLAVVLLLSACGAVQKMENAVADVEQGSAQTSTYALNEQQARKVILQAINEGWPDVEVNPLHAGKIGYHFQLRFAIDREQMSVEALNSSSGYSFLVTNRGTAPLVGVPARGKLITLLQKYAQQ